MSWIELTHNAIMSFEDIELLESNAGIDLDDVSVGSCEEVAQSAETGHPGRSRRVSCSVWLEVCCKAYLQVLIWNSLVISRSSIMMVM